MAHIAYLGTGLLGSAFVEAALGRGDRVTVWNRTRDKLAPLVALGATAADSPADAVRGAERVHVVLRDDASVDDVLHAARAGLAPTTIIVDHTTNQPALTKARAMRLEADAVAYLHCPVFIGPVMARQGQGTILACGPTARFEAVRPALQQQASRVEYLGERPDAAATLKLCGNAFIVGVTALISDALSVGRGGGLSPDAVLALFEYFNPAGQVASRGRKIAARDFAATFELAMARKDVRLMLETAGDAPLAVLPGVAARMDALLAAGHGHDDLAVLGRDATS
ncbi:MAG: NAD(P)-dependent oxidoreductase [Gemmatimonadaceae bacterium]|nr:NAD(P)-dependent oxidoreductase [Gemmatimonadaceae bacterium]